jgi:hypothetical protein
VSPASLQQEGCSSRQIREFQVQNQLRQIKHNGAAVLQEKMIVREEPASIPAEAVAPQQA